MILDKVEKQLLSHFKSPGVELILIEAEPNTNFYMYQPYNKDNLDYRLPPVRIDLNINYEHTLSYAEVLRYKVGELQLDTKSGITKIVVASYCFTYSLLE